MAPEIQQIAAKQITASILFLVPRHLRVVAAETQARLMLRRETVEVVGVMVVLDLMVDWLPLLDRVMMVATVVVEALVVVEVVRVMLVVRQLPVLAAMVAMALNPQ